MNDSRPFLEQIVARKHQYINSLYTHTSLDAVSAKVVDRSPSSFYAELVSPKLSLIAEVKKASPSRGIINPSFDPSELALQFKQAGASVLSVLTEEHYFKGHSSYVMQAKDASGLPALRKDFIIDPIQVYESKLLGADAILLILAILDQEQAQHLLDIAHSIGLDVLIETHDQEEFDRALDLNGGLLIGVNNRNLSTFEVDNTLASRLMAANKSRLRDNHVIVAESGYFKADELRQLQEEGFGAVLIGEGLVKSPELLDFFREN